MQTITQFIVSHKKKVVAFVLVVVVLAYVFRNGSNGTVITISVVKGSIVQQVSVTGKTKPSHEVNLAFAMNGKVSSAPLTIGDKVSAGQVLATLDQAELSANLAKVKADLTQGQIKLDQISKQSGDTYQNARVSMIAAIRDAYTRTDDSIRNNIDQFFFQNTAQSNTYIDFSFIDGSYQYNPIMDSSLRTSINTSREVLNNSLDMWQRSLIALSTADDLAPYVTEAEKNVNDVRTFLGYVAQAVNSLPQPDFSHQSVIAGYRTTVSLARTNISTAQANLVTAKDKLNNAPRETQSSTGTAGFDEVLAQQAQVAQYQAEVQSREALLAKATLTSPINGVVTKYDTKTGEIVNSGTPVVSVISGGNLQIDAHVSEVNIGKIAIGNSVSITFDAFPGKTFTGSVAYIDPGETLVDGVVNYNVTINFDQTSESVKSGLTSNLIIENAKKDSVLKIPQFSIVKKNGKSYVMKVVGKTVAEVEVTTGFIGNDGTVEVLSGLALGDIVQSVGK